MPWAPGSGSAALSGAEEPGTVGPPAIGRFGL